MTAGSTSLSAASRMRYARQVSLDEIGEAGQARLCGARARLAKRAASSRSPDSTDIAALYLERAGLRVERADELSDGDSADAVIAAHSAAALLTRAGDPRLLHAAAWLVGSFEAVEAIKAILCVGVAARIPDAIVLGRELAEQKS